MDYDKFTPPHNDELPITQSLPPWAAELFFPLLTKKLRVAQARDPHEPTEITMFLYCDYCDGWIEGQASETDLDIPTTDRLPGRKGRAYFCPRCGKEISFVSNSE